MRIAKAQLSLFNSIRTMLIWALLATKAENLHNQDDLNLHVPKHVYAQCDPSDIQLVSFEDKSTKNYIINPVLWRSKRGGVTKRYFKSWTKHGICDVALTNKQ